MFLYHASVPIVLGNGARVPLTTVPSLRVNTSFSRNGPQVGDPGATSFGWLRPRQRDGIPGFAATTVSKCRLWDRLEPGVASIFEPICRSTLKFSDIVYGVLFWYQTLPAPLIGVYRFQFTFLSGFFGDTL